MPKCETAKTSSDSSITDGNGITLSLVRPTVSLLIRTVTQQLRYPTTDKTEIRRCGNGWLVYIAELSAPAGYKVDKTVYSLKVELERHDLECITIHQK